MVGLQGILLSCGAFVDGGFAHDASGAVVTSSVGVVTHCLNASCRHLIVFEKVLVWPSDMPALFLNSIALHLAPADDKHIKKKVHHCTSQGWPAETVLQMTPHKLSFEH